MRGYLGILSVSASLALLLLAGCAPKAPNYDYSREPDPRRDEYVIGVSDTLAINVWKNPQLTTDVVVRPDGTITMPLVGDMVARGKTPSTLRQEIASRVAEFVKLDASEITVAVTGVNSYRFTISGEVQNPGVLTSQHYLTIAEAIALAGGFTRFAERNKITVSRRDDKGEVRTIPIVYDLVEDGTKPEMNIVVLAGDSIHVP